MRDTNISIPSLRESASAFVDMFCDELLNQPAKAKEIENVMRIIHNIKATRWSVMVELADVHDWYKKQIASDGALFSEFIERGYTFMMLHYINEYSPDRVIELRTSSAFALRSTFVALDTTDFNRGRTSYLSQEAWEAVIESYPWLMFVAILRNTYIDMGDEEPAKNPNGGGDGR